MLFIASALFTIARQHVRRRVIREAEAEHGILTAHTVAPAPGRGRPVYADDVTRLPIPEPDDAKS